MRQALCECETTQLELKSWQMFLAIKRYERSESKNVMKLVKKLAHIVCATSGKAAKNPF